MSIWKSTWNREGLHTLLSVHVAHVAAIEVQLSGKSQTINVGPKKGCEYESVVPFPLSPSLSPSSFSLALPASSSYSSPPRGFILVSFLLTALSALHKVLPPSHARLTVSNSRASHLYLTPLKAKVSQLSSSIRRGSVSLTFFGQLLEIKLSCGFVGQMLWWSAARLGTGIRLRSGLSPSSLYIWAGVLQFWLCGG